MESFQIFRPTTNLILPRFLSMHLMEKNIPVELGIVDADVSALLGIDILDKKSLTHFTVSNGLIKQVPDIFSTQNEV